METDKNLDFKSRKVKNEEQKILCCIFGILILTMFASTVYATNELSNADAFTNYITSTRSSGTINESEANNTMATADITYDDRDNYGYISSTTDEDWWKIEFDYDGQANFRLGNIPAGCDYDLYLYIDPSSGVDDTLLTYSINYDQAAELIQWDVEAGMTYYAQIVSFTGSSTSSSYWFRAKNYPSHTIPNVSLYTQQENNTCGCACGRMILSSYGVSVSEATFKARATAIAGTSADFTYVYVIKDTLNYFLSANNKTTRYKYTSVASHTTADYQELVLTNILNGNPVQANLLISSTTYFPYTVNYGHYVVIKGMTYNTDNLEYNTIVNDPHYDYSGVYTIPISVILDYTHAHRSGGYLIHVVD